MDEICTGVALIVIDAVHQASKWSARAVMNIALIVLSN